MISGLKKAGKNTLAFLSAILVERFPTSGKEKVMNTKASYVSVAAALATLSDDELSAIAEDPQDFKEYAAARVAKIAANTFVVSLGDNEVPEQYREAAAKWRKYAASVGYTGPVAWQVKEGFTLKSNAPKAGPCYDNFAYLQDWELRNDEATVASVVFWVPVLAENSTGLSVAKMEERRAELRQNHGLPENHCASFGSAALLCALILAHFKRTGKRVPLNCNYAASDTLCAVGFRLLPGNFGEDGLDCSYWDEDSVGVVGFFLLGVEALGK